MATPKHVIRYLLIQHKNGMNNREVVDYLIKYTKSKDYHNALQLMTKWRRQYRVVDDKLVLNEEFNDKLRKINARYRNPSKPKRDI